MELKDLKNSYAQLAKKYKLPDFDYMNDNFEIEKIERDTDSLLRLVRKVMMEKVVNSLSFIELFLNPSNAPRMYLSYIKSMTSADLTALNEIYSSLGDISIISLALEMDSTEKKEAEVIRQIIDAWELQRPKFAKVLNNMKNPAAPAPKKEKSYFG